MIQIGERRSRLKNVAKQRFLPRITMRRPFN